MFSLLVSIGISIAAADCVHACNQVNIIYMFRLSCCFLVHFLVLVGN